MQRLKVSIHAPTRGATRLCIFVASLLPCFNPRTHTGCDKFSLSPLVIEPMFQSTHPHGVRRYQLIYNDYYRDVSIHAPTRGATSLTSVSRKYLTMFQSTHPHGVRPMNGGGFGGNGMFQSTHPHGVRHQGAGVGDWLQPVSIHAPTRGATLRPTHHFPKCTKVSIHAPTRGATEHLFIFRRTPFSFNPRTHTGCDYYQMYRLPYEQGFNPRTHTGCDPL